MRSLALLATLASGTVVLDDGVALVQNMATVDSFGEVELSLNQTLEASCKRCGTGWSNANTRRGTFCPGGLDRECPSGQKCYGDITSCSTPPRRRRAWTPRRRATTHRRRATTTPRRRATTTPRRRARRRAITTPRRRAPRRRAPTTPRRRATTTPRRRAITTPRRRAPRRRATTTPRRRVSSTGMMRGFWQKVWAQKSLPSDTTDAMAFNGWADPARSKSSSAGVNLGSGKVKWMSMGGGNNNGRFSVARLNAWTTAINRGDFSGYDGIAFDPEEGPAGLCASLTKAVQAAKAQNLKTMITVPHQQPYGIPDAPALMRCIFQMNGLDYLSPQLYTSGSEQALDKQLSNSPSGQIQWSAYKGATKTKIVPSLSYGCQYKAAQDFFKSQGVTTIQHGYVAWSAGCPGGGGSSPSPSPGGGGCINKCGTAWNRLTGGCCNGGTDRECSGGLKCFSL